MEDCNNSFWALTPTGFYLSSAPSPSDSCSSGSAIGQTGSMARFAIIGERMYAVSNTELKVFDISSPLSPTYAKSVATNNWNIEIIFPFKNKLFIGSQNGMFTYNLNDPDNPALDGQFAHFKSCDPVIADDSFAYVTLSSGTVCQGFTNELEILSLNSLRSPQLLKT